ncbi:hypothetical protein [Kitasatospora sp. McL0602]|uniref:hypothetical protein n=1 Tax=Kitasatospora sp. McL0602 TaxID=3439530 RepID=UPI003F89ECC0
MAREGEWWRVDGPWRVLGRPSPQEPVAGDQESVYAPQVPVQPGPAAAAMPAAVPVEAAGPDGPDGAWLIARAAPGPPRTPADFPEWDSVVFDFSDSLPKAEPEAPAATAVPEQREPEPVAVKAVAVKTAALAGRRPSVLVLLAAVVLLAGAVTGQFLALLAGWALGYVAPKLGDLTRKFAVLGIPLATMAGSTVWFWGRAKGRWGSPLAQGAQLGHVTWAAAPGVLRVAGALSALFLLAVTLRRPKA